MPIHRRQLLLAAAAAPILAACGGSDPNLVERARSESSLNLLVEALGAGGLEGTLATGGPFTLFAPTDAAFAALLTELGVSKAALFADRALLTTVLTYHVVSGRVGSSAVPIGRAVDTLQGGFFKPDVASGQLSIVDGRNRSAGVLLTDLHADNGVIHLIDKVLLPADKTIVQTAQSIPDFSILVEAVTAAGLGGALSDPGPLTVFAPTDAAFAALLTELGVSKADLLADTALLTSVLTYHVVPGRVLKAGVPVGVPITTLQGGVFTVDSTLKITDARSRVAGIAATDVLTSNGVIHVIDKVILPAS